MSNDRRIQAGLAPTPADGNSPLLDAATWGIASNKLTIGDTIAANIGPSSIGSRTNAISRDRLRLEITPVENGYVIETGRMNGSLTKTYVALDLEQVQEHVVRAITEHRLGD